MIHYKYDCLILFYYKKNLLRPDGKSWSGNLCVLGDIIIENDIWIAVFNELDGYDGYWCGKYIGYD